MYVGLSGMSNPGIKLLNDDGGDNDNPFIGGLLEMN